MKRPGLLVFLLQRLLLLVSVSVVAALTLSGAAANADTQGAKYFDNLFSVARSPLGQWIAVGSKGLMLVSDDNGATWQRHLLKERPGNGLLQDFDLYSIRFAPGTQSGWVSGERGLIFFSADGGRNWQPRSAPPSDNNIFRVAPIDSSSACAVGTDGTLLCTQDSGQHWLPYAFNRYIDLYDATFVGNNGWVVGAYRTILHTADGGRTWQLQRGGNRKVLDEEAYFAVTFSDAMHGWVAGLSGELIYTSDGGQAWQTYKSESLRPTIFAAYDFNPALWLGGKRGAMMELTRDDHWRDVHVSFQDITDLAFSGQTGIAVGLGGTILRTTDGGKTWHSVGSE